MNDRNSASAPIQGDASASTARVVALKSYAIGTAARLAGIPPETLRIWERRYQLLSPGRTGGGHRLYSEDDVTLLRAVKRLVDSGMRIGAVAGLDHDQIRAQAARMPPLESTVAERASPLIEEIIEAARTLDERRVAQLLDRPLLLTSGEEVVHTLYLRLLKRVGELWHAGNLSIGVEHFLEKMVTARIMAILQSIPKPSSGRLALCACPPGDRHEVGLFAAALTLKAGGFPVTILGADVPAADLAVAVEAAAPAVVVLAVTNELSLATRTSLVAVLNGEGFRHVPLILGGINARVLADLLDRPATIVHDMTELVGITRRLATN
jgi:DNA-binding transcriptional MerR regulator/methylmalonyl-CoA mutase cobalamin-binding subunit